MRKSNFALRLQPSLLEEVRKLAEQEGVAVNQLIRAPGGRSWAMKEVVASEGLRVHPHTGAERSLSELQAGDSESATIAVATRSPMTLTVVFPMSMRR